ITLASSVLGIRYDSGVMIASDNLVNFGPIARHQNVERVFQINHKTLMAGSGDFPDVQRLKREVDHRVIRDQILDDGFFLKPRALAMWMGQLVYRSRSTPCPLRVELVVGGMQNEVPYLAYVDNNTMAFENFVVASSMAQKMCLPVIGARKPKDRDFTREECADLIKESMEALYYRSCQSIAQYTVGECTAEECVVRGPFSVNERWTNATLKCLI
ncbi:hypothetical protein KR018_000807, partial [Drosophila ironensis]